MFQMCSFEIIVNCILFSTINRTVNVLIGLVKFAFVLLPLRVAEAGSFNHYYLSIAIIYALLPTTYPLLFASYIN